MSTDVNIWQITIRMHEDDDICVFRNRLEKWLLERVDMPVISQFDVVFPDESNKIYFCLCGAVPNEFILYLSDWMVHNFSLMSINASGWVEWFPDVYPDDIPAEDRVPARIKKQRVEWCDSVASVTVYTMSNSAIAGVQKHFYTAEETRRAIELLEAITAPWVNMYKRQDMFMPRMNWRKKT